jgi:hypothetical protein
MNLSRNILMDEAGAAGGAGGGAAADAGAKAAADATAKAASDKAAVDAKAAADKAAAGAAAGGGDAKSPWADNWRDGISTDEKERKQLERYASPKEIWNKARALEQRLSSGELKSALKKDATPEETKAWRAENGLPEKAEGYNVVFADGSKPSDEDLPILKTFLESAHKANYTQAQVTEALEWHYANQERITAARKQADAELIPKVQDALRAEWQGDYRARMSMFHALLDRAPSGLKDKLMNGRLADGTPIGSSVEAIKWITDLEMSINPAATVVPGAGTNQAQAIDDEIAKLTKMMGDRSSEYWKGQNAEKNQARYRDLIRAQEKMAQKAA